MALCYEGSANILDRQLPPVLKKCTFKLQVSKLFQDIDTYLTILIVDPKCNYEGNLINMDHLPKQNLWHGVYSRHI